MGGPHQLPSLAPFAHAGTHFRDRRDNGSTALLGVRGHGFSLEGKGLLIMCGDSGVTPNVHVRGSPAKNPRRSGAATR